MAFATVPNIKPRRVTVNQGWSPKQITLASVLLFAHAIANPSLPSIKCKYITKKLTIYTCGCVAALLSLRTLKHTALLDAHAAEIRHSGNPLAEREVLVKRVAAWNINAEQNGLPLLRLEEEKPKQQKEEVEKEEEAKEQEQERREAQEEEEEEEAKKKKEGTEESQRGEESNWRGVPSVAR
eukprot:scaffold64247_cov16-Tisochrysis_lutea.AAC.1